MRPQGYKYETLVQTFRDKGFTNAQAVWFATCVHHQAFEADKTAFEKRYGIRGQDEVTRLATEAGTCI